MIYKNDIKLFSSLLTIDTYKLLDILLNYLKNFYDIVYSTEDFIYAVGEIPILLVAHLDTVWYDKPKILCSKDKILWTGKEGLGADDRAGVFAILKLLKNKTNKPSILFTMDEEPGALGAKKFIKAFPRPNGPIKYIIEIDRRGAKQSVFYGCKNKKFKEFINSFGFHTELGSFSDISFICPAWNIAGVNLSAGYYNEHTVNEIFNFKDLFYTINRIKRMIANYKIAPFFEYK